MKKTKSVISESEYCLICGARATEEHHLLFGSSRAKAELYGIKIPICASCHTMGNSRIHDNPVGERLSKMLGQAIFEREMALKGADREECKRLFLEEFDMFYL